MTTYYKFRDFKNKSRIEDLLEKCEIWASPYDTQNDLAEGDYYYFFKELTEYDVKQIKNYKLGLRIASLTRKYRRKFDTLMWAHYANANTGIAIEVSLSKDIDVRKITYSKRFEYSDSDNPIVNAKNILTHKTPIWKYERESRVFSMNETIPVNILRVITGPKISDEDYDFVAAITRNSNFELCRAEKYFPELAH